MKPFLLSVAFPPSGGLFKNKEVKR